MSTQRVDDPRNIVSADNNATVRVQTGIIGSAASGTHQISKGSVINLGGNDYSINNLIASSGESEVFEAERAGNKYVLKYYFSNYKPKDEVIRKLQNLNRKDVMSPMEYGLYIDRFWEINEYMVGGTFDKVIPLKDISRLKILLRQINEAIHACHANGIIHRDIKPANIFFRTDKMDDIVLGDFGIASPLQEGESYRVTTVARTSTYAAPELFTNINNLTTLDAKVDYYALGICLLEAWIGEDPFRQIPEFNIMRIKSEGRVFIPGDMNEDLQNLIKGLITTEPPKRWGYEEINKWLNGEPVKQFYRTHDITFKTYEFDRMQGILVEEPKELAYHMEKYPQKAAKQLYSHSILDWIGTGSADMYSEIHHIIEKEYPNTSEENIDAGVTKTIYILDKDRPFTAFDGVELYSPFELGKHIGQHTDFYLKDLQNKAARFYMFLEARGYQDRADKFRKYFREQDAEKALHLVILDLQDNKLELNGQVFENLQQIMIAGDDIKQQVLKDVLNKNSRLSVWLDVNFSDLGTGINNWRSNKTYQSLDTLKYALKLGGFRINNKEAFDIDSFYALFKEELPSFTTASDAEKNREDANYWLIFYQRSSFPTIAEFLLEKEGCNYQDFLILFEYLLQKNTLTPLETIQKVAPSIQRVTGDDPAKLKAFVELSRKALAEYIDAKRSLAVFSLENLEEVSDKISEMQHQYPLFASQLMASLNEKFSAEVHNDLQQVSKNSDSFLKLQQQISAFLSKDLVKDLPYHKHWTMEQQLTDHKRKVIEINNEKEKEKDVQLIESEFSKYVKTQVNSKVNFLEKGKSFYRLFLLIMGFAVLASFILGQYIDKGKIVSFSSIGVAVVILIVFNWYGKHVKNRSPNTGLGMIWDPVHKLFGRLIYAPILKRIKKDPNNIYVQKASADKNAEIQKAVNRSKGKTYNEWFEEYVRITFLEPRQLEMELSQF